MILYHENKADDATITSEQESGNYSASNVQDSRLSRIYRGEEYSEVLIDAGGELKNISDAYENLVVDPTDLTTGNWVNSNGASTELVDMYINGNQFTKITTDGTSDPQTRQTTITLTDSAVKHCAHYLIRNGELLERTECFMLQTGSASTVKARFEVVWDTLSVSITVGTGIYKFIDNTTLEVWLITETGEVGYPTWQYRLDCASTGYEVSGGYVYATECQVVDNTEEYYPFLDGSKVKDEIEEDFTLPGQFVFDCIITPYFNYDTATDKTIYSFTSGGAVNKMELLYNQAQDRFQAVFREPNFSTLVSDRFDDGTSYDSINQRIRVIGSMNLTSGGQNDSRLIVIPLENGSVSEDDTWSTTPDIKTLVYDTLYIGHDSGSEQANCEYEYIRFYEGLLECDVTCVEDVDVQLKDKKVLFDGTYQSKVTATDILLANTTINDGDTVLLRANDVDSFGEGTPIDEVVGWDKDIIHHRFTEATHQYWWLSVNSSNSVEIGRLFLGERYQTPGISTTLTKNRITTDRKTTSIGGSTYGDKRYNNWQFITNFPAVTQEQSEEIEAIFNSITTIKPFFVEFDEECSDLERYYVTLENDEVRFTVLSNPNYYTAGINMIEEK